MPVLLVAFAEPVIGSAFDLDVYSMPTWEFMVIENKAVVVIKIYKREALMTLQDAARMERWIPSLGRGLKRAGWDSKSVRHVKDIARDPIISVRARFICPTKDIE